MHDETELLIPDYDPINLKTYPGDIKPGYYNKSEVKALVKKHRNNPEALQLLRDMLEE